MPVRYEYDPRLRTIEVTCSGSLSLDEIQRYFTDLAAEESIPPGTVEVVDLREVDEFGLSSSDAFKVPAGYRTARDSLRIRATLLVASRPVNYGMARMIQAYFQSQLPNHVFEVFRSREEAEARLAELE